MQDATPTARTSLIGVLLVVLLAGCRARGPVYEYGETTTITSTGPAAGPAETTSTIASRPSVWRRGEAR